ncbi:hypothetical protein, partial [Halopseudomonas pelagia]|uniref:hypothetical protein n=1 Tax=Halopseudomonas pelagia TaxID=553151 RepID=UPI0030DDD38A
RAHNPKVVGSNPAPATSLKTVERTCPSAVFFACFLPIAILINTIALLINLTNNLPELYSRKMLSRNYGDHASTYCLPAVAGVLLIRSLQPKL